MNKLPNQLLALNREVAAKIERGEPVTAPGMPPGELAAHFYFTKEEGPPYHTN